MAGSGGASYYPSDWTAKRSEKIVQDAEKEAFKTNFRTELSSFLSELLGQYNARDSEGVSEKLNELREFFSTELQAAIIQKFGGSVAKHTYIDGLSDVDALFIMNSSDVNYANPNALVQQFADLAKNKLGPTVDVKAGEMAVTLTYKDGTELQVLPATTTAAGNLRVSSPEGDSWSNIKPREFQSVLSEVNKNCNFNLVPTIKLAKAAIATLPEAQRLSGYHIESMAVDAFKKYDGSTTKHEMLVNFFNSAKEQVLSPKKDKTGQSRHLDDYLGDASSNERKRAHYVLDRLEKRMRNANAAGSLSAWSTIFGTEA